MSSCLLAPIDSSTPPEVTLRLSRGSSRAVELPSAVSDLPPVTFAGEYELQKLLGRGGMGVVYLARHRRLKRQVAYKVLTTLGDIDPEALLRFRVEAETLARLQHPGIVQVFDSGIEHGTPFIAMEYVPGGSLADRIQAGRPTPHQAAALIATVASAVGHAHALGVIHRDLKPANILLDALGQPKVADFGLARDVAGGPGSYVSRTGTVAGTPGYMPPEQFTGTKELTPAVDVWALGVMLYELLTGAKPFPGTDPQQILINVLQQEPVRPRVWQAKLPADLETICLKCLQQEPHGRYASGKELADDLLRFLDNRSILARPVGPMEKSVRWCQRNRVVAGLTAATLFALILGSVVSLAFAARAVRERANAVAAAETEGILRRQAELAVEEEQKARHEAESMTTILDSLLTSIQPGRDAVVGLRTEMARAAEMLKSEAGDPLVRARLFYTLALTRRKLGDFEEAVSLMERALAIRSEILGPDHDLTIQTASEMGYTYVHVKRGEDAVRLLKPIVAAKQGKLPDDSTELLEALQLLQVAYYSAGQIAEAADVGERILTICVKRFGDDHEETEWVRINLPRYSVEAGRFDQAIPVLKKAYARFQATLGPTSTQLICARAQLGRCLLASGQPHEALPYLKEMYESAIARVGPTHPHAVSDRNDLAKGYEACGLFAFAVPHRRELQEYFHNLGDTQRASLQADLLAKDLAASDTQTSSNGLNE